MQTLELTRPDDWHLHVRDGSVTRAVLPHTARCFARAVIMPNLRPPVTTVAAASAYRERVVSALPPEADFEPLMTLYLTDDTPPEEIAAAARSGFIIGVKLYPAGATTHSAAGVTSIEGRAKVFEEMQRLRLPLLVHGEVVDPSVDIFDRERVFLERVLAPLVERFPELPVVLEHVSTREGVAFVSDARKGVAATITAHHLLLSRNALFAGGFRPHHYCLPVVKGEEHRQAVLGAATGGSPRFFLGTDSAPHPRSAKESACGSAGIYTAHAALELYAEAFEAAGALDRLEAFASFHGADFYGLPRNQGRVVLERRPRELPAEIDLGEGASLVPLRAGAEVAWTVREP